MAEEEEEEEDEKKDEEQNNVDGEHRVKRGSDAAAARGIRSPRETLLNMFISLCPALEPSNTDLCFVCLCLKCNNGECRFTNDKFQSAKSQKLARIAFSGACSECSITPFTAPIVITRN